MPGTDERKVVPQIPGPPRLTNLQVDRRRGVSVQRAGHLRHASVQGVPDRVSAVHTDVDGFPPFSCLGNSSSERHQHDKRSGRWRVSRSKGATCQTSSVLCKCTWGLCP